MKKLYTRDEFTEHLLKSSKEMANDQNLCDDALNILVRADEYKWIHQTTWFGEPVLNIPHDLFALQEIIYKTRPEYIIEVGVAWGGSLLFYSTLMEVLGGKKVIGIDVYVPDDLKDRISSHGRLSERIEWIVGSSVEEKTIEQLESILSGSRRTMILLDSDHTHQHVLKELELYQQFVGKGCYLICGDTIVEKIPEQKHRPREWGPGNNPMTALNQFLEETDRFVIDSELENKLLMTCNPNGFLCAVKD